MANLTGRKKEARKILTYERAVEVAKLMLGQVQKPKRLFFEDYVGLPRKNLQAGFVDVKRKWGEVRQFCSRNFKDATVENLAELYEPLYKHGGVHRLPLKDLIGILGVPQEGRLKGAPLHSTVCLSPWGLQTEFPEMHLIRDLSFAFNAVLDLEKRFKEIEAKKLTWSEAKKEKEEIAQVRSQLAFHMRISLICCFNLLEAYANGLAWCFLSTTGDTDLSKNQKKVLQGPSTSILDKLVKIPKIIAGKDSGPLSVENPPLSVFRDLIKPYRDSIVHASPFSAPERFGGYDKLSKIYELEPTIVKQAVKMTIEILAKIHQFTGGRGELPPWMPVQNPEGYFQLQSSSE